MAEFELSDGGHLHGYTAGEGEIRTVLLHGWAVSGQIWAPILRRWPKSRGSVLSLDLRGAGWSHKPSHGYTPEDYGRDVIEVLKQLPGPVILVGQSMGGQIAQWVAVHAPELVCRLVLVSPVPAGGVPFEAADVAYFRSLAGRRTGFKTVLASMMAVALDPEQLEELVQTGATVTPQCFLQNFDGWRTADFADSIGQINVPTTVIAGGAEQPLSPEVLQAAVVALIPGATLEIVPDVGHYGQFEAPERFAQALFAACWQSAPSR